MGRTFDWRATGALAFSGMSVLGACGTEAESLFPEDPGPREGDPSSGFFAKGNEDSGTLGTVDGSSATDDALGVDLVPQSRRLDPMAIGLELRDVHGSAARAASLHQRRQANSRHYRTGSSNCRRCQPWPE